MQVWPMHERRQSRPGLSGVKAAPFIASQGTTSNKMAGRTRAVASSDQMFSYVIAFVLSKLCIVVLIKKIFEIVRCPLINKQIISIWMGNIIVVVNKPEVEYMKSLLVLTSKTCRRQKSQYLLRNRLTSASQSRLLSKSTGFWVDFSFPELGRHARGRS